MKRKVYKELLKWHKSPDRKPLIVMGARQVGKTWLMEEFARREYPGNTVEVNLMKNEALRRRFEDVDLDAESIVDLLQLSSGKRIVPGKTLVIIDEIQEAPRALTALKYLQEEMPELAVMVAGSLLGLAVKREYEVALEWLRDAGLVRIVHNVATPMMPLKAHEEFGCYKLYVHDVGLLGAMCDLPSGMLLEKSEIFTFAKGAITEQFVCEELVTHGMTPYYWSLDNARAEIEFLVQGEQAIFPVEAKAETNLKAQSLKSYLDRYHPPFGIRLSMQKRTSGKMVEDVPLYAIAQVVKMTEAGDRYVRIK